MKNFPALFFILLFIPLCIDAQRAAGITVKGKVTDQQTKEPVIRATIFLENTTLGTTTNDNGEFIIKDIPYGPYTIAISSIGYEFKTLNIQAYEEQTFSFNIELKQKAIMLDEVKVVSRSPDEWNNNLRIFKREFLGNTANAKKTTILNPEVINLEMDGSGHLIAYSDSVIKVENRALGYMMYILLDSFSFDRDKRVKFLLHSSFKELTPVNEEEKEKWIERRRENYVGSRKHFFNALVNRKLDQESFAMLEGELYSLNRGNGHTIEPSDLGLYTNYDSTVFKVMLANSIKIDCRENMTSSIIKPVAAFILLDKYGNELSGISTEVYGHWAEQRIADTLPFDYVYDRRK